jgi:hypothetical protein
MRARRVGAFRMATGERPPHPDASSMSAFMFYDVVSTIHILAVVLVFGVVFADSIIDATTMRITLPVGDRASIEAFAEASSTSAATRPKLPREEAERELSGEQRAEREPGGPIDAAVLDELTGGDASVAAAVLG